MSPLVYVYAVVAAAPDAELGDGIDGAPVRFITNDALAAVVSDVDDSSFGEAALDRNMRDLDWLGPRAAGHQDVNARLLGACDAVVPLAFGTIFNTPESVRRMLEDGAADLMARLASVRRRSEWVLTVERDQPVAADSAARSGDVAALDREIDASKAGRGYLLRRRREDLVREQLRRQDAEAVTAAVAGVAAVVERSYAEPVVAGGAVLARISLLVERDREDELASSSRVTADQWAARGYRFTLTGPWPAYRFGGLREEVAGAAR